MVLAGTAQEAAVRDLDCAAACEVFADRAYHDDATLVDRCLPGAVIHDPSHAAIRVVEMIRAGAIITESGKHIPTRIDPVCLHSDTAKGGGDCQFDAAVARICWCRSRPVQRNSGQGK